MSTQKLKILLSLKRISLKVYPGMSTPTIVTPLRETWSQLLENLLMQFEHQVNAVRHWKVSLLMEMNKGGSRTLKENRIGLLTSSF
jgi:hypothetical protein